jgi:hypothetical protein
MAVSTLDSKHKLRTQLQVASLPDLQPAPVSLPTLPPSLKPVRRLVVLVPNLEMDEVEMARRIWEMASSPHLAVLFLALCNDALDEPRMRRRLATLAALTRDDRIAIETHLEPGHNWTRKVQGFLREDDMVVCLANHTLGRTRKLLSQALTDLGMSVWTLKGLDMNSIQVRHKPLGEFLFWVVSMTIIAGFLWLQVRVLNISEDSAQNTLLYLSVPIEIGFLWIWNNISM